MEIKRSKNHPEITILRVDETELLQIFAALGASTDLSIEKSLQYERLDIRGIPEISCDSYGTYEDMLTYVEENYGD